MSRSQLLDAGVAPHVVDDRVARGLLTGLHRGVYRVGPVAAPLEDEMAAFLACGHDSLLGGASAAALWGFAAGSRPVLVLVGGGSHRASRGGIRIRRVHAIPADERATVDGIAVTTPARTLLEMAALQPAIEVERALAAAQREGLVTEDRLRKVIERHAGRPGTRLLAALLKVAAGPSFTRSEAEVRLLALLRRVKLPPPRTNCLVLGYEVDFLWPELRLIVEVDGYRFHRSADSFQNDRRRDVRLNGEGYRVLRFTWNQITREPDFVAAQIARCIGRAEGRSGLA